MGASRVLGGVWSRLRRRFGRAGVLGRGRAADGPAAGTPGRWAALDDALTALHSRPEREPLQPSGLLRCLRELVEHGELATPPDEGPPHQLRVAQVRTVTRRLVRQNRYRPARDLLDLVVPAWDPDPVTGLQAVAAHATTSLTGEPVDDLEPVAAAALEGADRAWAAGDVDLTAELVVIGAGLLLHRDLHADVVHSPLADRPADFLSPIRGSVAMTSLRAPVAPAAGSGERAASPGTGRRTVVVLPGTYPRFARPLVDLLGRQRGLGVEVVDLPKESRSLRWLGTDPELVRLRLLATSGQLPEGSPDRDAFGVPTRVHDLLARADVVVADWGDRGALWASLATPPTTRLVVRLHGMDSLSLWVHSLDWSRVDALVTVSAHHAALTDAILQHGAAPPDERLPRCQVVPHVVRLGEPARTSRQEPERPPPVREPHTLGMIGWGKPVKDPSWAVAVLAGLLRRGGDWRLRLVGDGFQPGGVVTGQEYAARFAERITRSDVAGAVELVPQTDDVPTEVARLGFVLSASRRESFHLGLVEGVLGGAVPVVRDWPFYARHGGPARLFPPDWVVPDVDAAVERVWAMRGEADRVAAAGRARRQVAERLDPDRVEELMLQVVLGALA